MSVSRPADAPAGETPADRSGPGRPRGAGGLDTRPGTGSGSVGDDARDGGGGPSRTSLVALLYFLSGAAGLVYEVAWARGLAHVIGSTAVASGLVLAAFLGCLGLGGRFGGRLADRSSSPLRTYGFLELAAAAWALLVPFLVPLVEGLYVPIASRLVPGARLAVGFAAAVVVTGPAAFALGATFPCALRAVARHGSAAGRASALLYGLNTLGAVAGALGAGLYGIAALGVSGTSRLAAFLAIGVGLVALLASRRDRPPAPVPLEAANGSARAPRAALAVAFLSGFVALGLETAGFRILVFFVEGFTASFAAMLGVFLAGLALGSLVVAPLLLRRTSAPVAAGVLLLAGGAAALALVLALPGFEQTLRDVRDAASRGGDPIEVLRRTALVGSAFLFLAPSVLLGAVYPVTVRWAVGDGEDGLGRRVGTVAWVNAAGAVAGPLVVLGLGLLRARGDSAGGPLFAWTLVAFTPVIAGAGILLSRLPRAGLALPLAGGAVGVAFGFLGPTFVARATPKALVEVSRVLRDGQGVRDPRRVLYDVIADETTTASVVETASGERILYTDEFAAAATGSSYPYMRLLGHLPALLAHKPARALVIAFGTGTTAGALAATSEVERLEIVETSRAVYDLAPRFDAVNRGVLADPRVVRRVDDGRHALLLHRGNLDVITLEPLMPYAPAATPFYTREFYELARDRLREGGVVAQWVPVHAMRPDLYAALLGTFFSVFPDGTLWFFEQSTILVGRKGTSTPAPEAVGARAQEMGRNLLAAGIRFPTALPGAYVANGRRVLDVIADPSKSSLEALRAAPLGELAGRIVTDDDPFPEAYPAPRSSVATTHEQVTLAWLAGLVDPSASADAPPLAFLAEGGAGASALVDSLVARSNEAAGEYRLATARDAAERAEAIERLGMAGRSYDAAAAAMGGADRAIDVRRVRLARRLFALSAAGHLARADAAAAAGRTADEDAALEALVADARRGYEVEPSQSDGTGHPAAAALLGEALARAGRCAEAVESVRAARVRWPREAALGAMSEWLGARRAGRDPAASGVAPALVARLARARPCADAPGEGVAPLLKSIRDEVGKGGATAIRTLGDRLLLRLAGDARAAAVALDALRAAAPGARGYAAEGERAALAAALSPGEPALLEALRADERERRLFALRAAAYRGLTRTGVFSLVSTELVKHAEPARRIEAVELVASDPAPEVVALLVDALADDDEGVRRAAWGSLTGRLSETERTEAGFDPAAPAEARAAAIARVRDRLKPR